MGQGGESLGSEGGVKVFLHKDAAMILNKKLLHTLTAIMLCALAQHVTAQSWPSRTVRIISPFAPGGGNDTVARFLAAKFTEQIGGTFVVENRAGSGGLIGADLVAKSAPDGHTLLVTSPEFAINPSMRSKMPYDTFKDFAYISQLASGQFMLASHPSVPVKNAKELLALAKARPGQLTYGTSGAGGINHLAGELLQSMSGIRWLHIPFKGAAPAMIAAMGGEVEFVFASTIGLVGPIKAGKLRGIAVTGSSRFAELPQVMTVAEAGIPGYSVTGWYGFYAAANTSPDIVRRLHEESRRALSSPDIKDKLVKAGNEPIGTPPAEFLAFVRAEFDKWAKVVKQANLRID
jgi:tripartite-type tricarboxylate transporter receptor subunit TctC